MHTWHTYRPYLGHGYYPKKVPNEKISWLEFAGGSFEKKNSDWTDFVPLFFSRVFNFKTVTRA